MASQSPADQKHHEDVMAGELLRLPDSSESGLSSAPFCPASITICLIISLSLLRANPTHPAFCFCFFASSSFQFASFCIVMIPPWLTMTLL